MIIKIKVHPNSNKAEIRKTNDKEYEISLKNKSENNKANIELMGLLAKYFNTSVKGIKIKTGKTSRRKVVSINAD